MTNKLNANNLVKISTEYLISSFEDLIEILKLRIWLEPTNTCFYFKVLSDFSQLLIQCGFEPYDKDRVNEYPPFEFKDNELAIYLPSFEKMKLTGKPKADEILSFHASKIKKYKDSQYSVEKFALQLISQIDKWPTFGIYTLIGDFSIEDLVNNGFKPYWDNSSLKTCGIYFEKLKNNYLTVRLSINSQPSGNTIADQILTYVKINYRILSENLVAKIDKQLSSSLHSINLEEIATIEVPLIYNVENPYIKRYLIEKGFKKVASKDEIGNETGLFYSFEVLYKGNPSDYNDLDVLLICLYEKNM